MHHEFFERLVVELLVEMGYGDSFEEAGSAIGRRELFRPEPYPGRFDLPCVLPGSRIVDSAAVENPGFRVDVSMFIT